MAASEDEGLVEWLQYFQCHDCMAGAGQKIERGFRFLNSDQDDAAHYQHPAGYDAKGRLKRDERQNGGYPQEYSQKD